MTVNIIASKQTPNTTFLRKSPDRFQFKKNIEFQTYMTIRKQYFSAYLKFLLGIEKNNLILQNEYKWIY